MMVKVLIGFFLGMTATAFAIEKHSDGSVTFTKDELETITINWVNINYALEAASERIRSLEKELAKSAALKCNSI